VNGVRNEAVAGFGTLLRACRRTAGLSQDELADRSGLSAHTISELERGRTQWPHRGSVNRLADALGLRDHTRDEFLAAAARRLAPVATGSTQTASGQPAEAPRTGRRIAPRQLPAATRHFTGRARELDELLALADISWDNTSAGAGTVVICVVDGMGGVGKTALAVHAAHLLQDRFPDGQLMIDLHGFTTGLDPLSPGDALNPMLLALGVPPQQVPDDLGARAACYRDRLAGTRTLIVLDNAVGTAQIRPLLPGTAGCLVLATSRRRLTGLTDAHTLALDILPEDDAIALLHRVSGPGRLSPGEVLIPELLALCGHLPLAISIIGARLRHHRNLTLPRIADQLRDDNQRLARLDDTEGDVTITTVFGPSLRALPPTTRETFRLLGLIPGADFDGYAAASLVGASLHATVDTLDTLVEHNLLLAHTPTRYRLHDLIRAYTRTLPPQDTADQPPPASPIQDDTTETDCAAVGRLLDYYLHTTQRASQHLARWRPYRIPPGRPPCCGPALDAREQAAEWIRTELANLTAAVSLCAAADFPADSSRPRYAVALSVALHEYLFIHGPWTQACHMYTTAITAAERLGDRHSEATVRTNLSEMRRLTGEYSAAILAGQAALALFSGLGDRLGEAGALTNLGGAWLGTGDHAAATRDLETALALFGDLGDRHGEATALLHLGNARSLAGDHRAAIKNLQTARCLYRDLGNRYGEAQVFNYLGIVRRMTGEYPAAIKDLETALNLYRDLGSQPGEADALTNLGAAHLAAAKPRQARTCYQQALDLALVLSLPLVQANALEGLGRRSLPCSPTCACTPAQPQPASASHQPSSADKPSDTRYRQRSHPRAEPPFAGTGAVTSVGPLSWLSCLAQHRAECGVGVGHELSDLLRAATGDGDPGRPLQRFLA
jgi:tetratricopeptide (TPR) repeat protein/transcriptional regulator with XRE-family HTH domain